MKLKDIIHLKETEPDMFWSAFYEQVCEDNQSEDFTDYLKYTGLESVQDFEQKLLSRLPYPYHRLLYPTEVKSDELTYVIQWFAMSYYDIFPVITGLVPFPDSSYYTFHFLGNELDVFTPHFLSRYAERSPRLEADLPLPNTLHFKKHQEGNDPQKKDFVKFAQFIGKFFGRNKINRLSSRLGSVIAHNEENKDQLVCLWTDGLSFCIPYADGKVFLHTTFLSYTDLKRDQIQAILPELFILIEDSCDRFPSQYGSFDEFKKRIREYIRNNDAN